MSMKKYRKTRQRYSNNDENRNQNVCANAVAKALGVSRRVRYLHNLEDLVKAARKKWTVRSRTSVWDKHFKKVPFTVNRFVENADTFTLKATEKKYKSENNYFCPEAKRDWVKIEEKTFRINAYIIYVKNHVILISRTWFDEWEVHTDTAPKEGADRRKIRKVYAVGSFSINTETPWLDELEGGQ